MIRSNHNRTRNIEVENWESIIGAASPCHCEECSKPAPAKAREAISSPLKGED